MVLVFITFIITDILAPIIVILLSKLNIIKSVVVFRVRYVNLFMLLIYLIKLVGFGYIYYGDDYEVTLSDQILRIVSSIFIFIGIFWLRKVYFTIGLILSIIGCIITLNYTHSTVYYVFIMEVIWYVIALIYLHYYL